MGTASQVATVGLASLVVGGTWFALHHWWLRDQERTRLETGFSTATVNRNNQSLGLPPLD